MTGETSCSGPTHLKDRLHEGLHLGAVCTRMRVPYWALTLMGLDTLVDLDFEDGGMRPSPAILVDFG
jgi:hypothetical protein